MSSQLILGLGKDGGLTDELSKNLVVSSVASRTRLIGIAMHEQAEGRSEGRAWCFCGFGYAVVDDVSEGCRW